MMIHDQGENMSHDKFHLLRIWSGMAILMGVLLACNLTTIATPGIADTNTPAIATTNALSSAPAETAGVTALTTVAPTATITSTETATSTPIVHMMTPAAPSTGILSQITDPNSSALASQHRANGGESFNTNLFERPFTATSMDYQPDLDIINTNLSQDTTWMYINISTAGQNPSGGLTGDYGVEVDLNMDGRGDLLVMAAKPGAAWSTDGVRVWTDSNSDVGGTHPILSDPPASTDGYDKLVFNAGVGTDPDAAWARISPSDPNTVQIAFKSSLINNSGKFMWGAWAMADSMLNPAWFDYNDHFSLAQAGSPLIEDTANYPLKALAQVDNTCHWVVGFKPTGTEPGICPVPATPTPKPTLTGSISGYVYNNGTNGGLKKAAFSKAAPGISVTLKSGSCASPSGVVGTMTTNSNGYYQFSSLAEGNYCVSAAAPTANSTGPQAVKLPSGGAVNNVDFFYYQKLI
jgi:hypothetical protein